MTTRWHKIGRDFWRERLRSVLVIAAIAAGIAAFQAVLSSYAILVRELDSGYLATRPASATLRTEAIDAELVQAVAQSPGVAAVEPRRVVPARIKTGPAQWRSLMLFVVRDYTDQRLSLIHHESGAWPPGAGEVLLERDAFQVAKAAIGDTVPVKMPTGDEHALKVAGRVHDVGQAQARMENVVYGYVTLETLALLGQEPGFDRLLILVADNPLDRDHVVSVAGEVQRWLEERGHPVRRVDIPEPGKHPHADLMGTLLLSISSFGLLVLGLSGILVFNLLSASMAAQVRQIGVMKAIGATRWQVAQIYFGQALLLGVAALLVALPLGNLGARALCTWQAGFLNFDMTSFAVPAWVYALVAGVGLGTPLLAAAWPIVRGSRVPVAVALADFGVADRGFGHGVLDRALARVSGLSRPLLLAVRNSFRRRARLVLTVLTLSTAGLFFMSALNVRSSMIGTLDELFATKRYDLSLSFGAMVDGERLERALAKTPGVVDSEGWIVTEGSLVTEGTAAGGSAGGHHGGAAASGDRFTVFGVPPGTRLLALDVVEGRDLMPGEDDALVANTALAARDPRVRVGQTVMLRMGPAERAWRVVGISREAFSPAVAYVSRGYFENAGGHRGMVNSTRLVLAQTDSASIDRVKEALDASLGAESIRVLSALSKADSRYGFDQHMLMIYVFLIATSALIGGVGGLGLMTTMSLNVLERRREMGALRALGASPRMVGWIVVCEGLAIGAMSFLLAAVLAEPLSRWLGNLAAARMFRGEMSFAFDLRGLAIWLVASLLLSALASFLPAASAARAPVHEALGCE